MRSLEEIAVLKVVAVLLLILGILFLLDYYFSSRLKVLTRSKNYFRAHWTLHALFSMTAIAMVAFFLTGQGGNSFYWLSWCVILTMGQFLSKFLFLFLTLPSMWCGAKWKRRIVCGGMAFVFLFWIGIAKAVWNGFNPGVREVELFFDDLPPSFEGYTVAFISDLHLGVYGTQSSMPRKAAALINEMKPDLLLSGGDWISMSSHELDPYVPVFKAMQAADGKFSVMGNHDYITYARRITPDHKDADRERMQQKVREMGFQFLDNSSVVIRRGNDQLRLLGTENWGEKHFGQDGDIDKAMEGAEEPEFRILLTHNTEHFRSQIAGKKEIALTLSGHTHAMQMVLDLGFIRLSPSSLIYKYWGGAYQEGNQYLYVNEGLGGSLYFLRWGTQSEITKIVLRSNPLRQRQ